MGRAILFQGPATLSGDAGAVWHRTRGIIRYNNGETRQRCALTGEANGVSPCHPRMPVDGSESTKHGGPVMSLWQGPHAQFGRQQTTSRLSLALRCTQADCGKAAAMVRHWYCKTAQKRSVQPACLGSPNVLWVVFTLHAGLNVLPLSSHFYSRLFQVTSPLNLVGFSLLHVAGRYWIHSLTVVHRTRRGGEASQGARSPVISHLTTSLIHHTISIVGTAAAEVPP
jgi:hypothetical protein